MRIKSNKNKLLIFVVYFLTVFIFLCFLNAIFPTQSDDIGREIGGIKAAKTAYDGWNGRFGELLLVAFGSWFSTTPFYAPINALIGASVILMIFALIFARLPKLTLKDASIFMMLITFLMLDPAFSFGSVFYWAAGSFNYLWAWFLILLYLLPHRFYWQKKFCFEGNEGYDKETKLSNSFSAKNIGKLILFLLVAFFAGWSTEFGIVFVVLQICFICYSHFIRKEKLPTWYYVGVVAFLLGWFVLYMSPGMHKRAALPVFEQYLSLSEIFKLPPKEFIKRILSVCRLNIYSILESYVLILFILVLCSFFYKIDFKPMIKIILFALPTILVLGINRVSIIIYPTVFFFIYQSGNENKKVKNILILILALLFSQFLFVGSLIQILAVAKRAHFQFNIINFALIAIFMHLCFEYFSQKKVICKAAFIFCVVFSFATAGFVSIECYNMSKKWDKMVESVEVQKAQGIENVVVDKNTFQSKYWSYGDWGNPQGIENIDQWPNTSYANYFGVKTYVAE
ncbi:MAG: DUF6056 family protein [Treponemataceae bacterium]